MDKTIRYQLVSFVILRKLRKHKKNGTQARFSDSERTLLLAGQVGLHAGLDDRVYGRPRDVLLALWG